MASKDKALKMIPIRFDHEDRRLLAAFQKRDRDSIANIVRRAIRRLAEAENLKVA